MTVDAARYQAALEQSTQAGTPTDRRDERDDVPAIAEADRAGCERWLRKVGFLSPGEDDKIWRAIKRNWISFLSATSTVPDEALAPNRKLVQFTSEDGITEESERQRRERFWNDRRQRIFIQLSFWRDLDVKEGLAQRWPPVARTALNAEDVGSRDEAFQTLIPDWKEATRRRYQAVLASLVAFLVHCKEEGALQEMGLELDESQVADILDLSQQVALVMGEFRDPRKALGAMGGVWGSVHELIVRALRKSGSTARNNPLVWWTAVLVRSALSGEKDFISMVGST